MKRIVALLLCAFLLCGAVAVAETDAAPEVGDMVSFGSYPFEDADAPEPIEWLVASVEDGEALLVSRYALNCMQYNRSCEVSLTWDNCALKEWLEWTFYNAAFSAEDKDAIKSITVDSNGVSSRGKVFLLSDVEVEKIFTPDYRACVPTPYAQAQGATPGDNGCCMCWVRNTGVLPGRARCIDDEGKFDERDANRNLGVRPAVWVDVTRLPAGSVKKPDGTGESGISGIGVGPGILLRQAYEAGMQIPTLAEGEKLYLGVSDAIFTKQTKLYLAFVAAPNDMSIREVTLFGEALKVPQEGGDPWLIDSQTRTKEDHWILLDAGGGTDIGLDEATDMGVYDLRLKDGEGSCRMVIAGHCEKPQDSVDGDFRAEAELKLYSPTGNVTIPAVDAPTVQQARDAGMKVPEPGAGEALYLSVANPSQAKAVYVAFVLSEDGANLKDLTVLVQDMDVEYRLGNKRVHTTSSKRSTTSKNAVEVAEDMDIGEIHFRGFALNDDGAEAVLRYDYHADDDNIDYPFDLAAVKFTRIQ